MNESGFKASLVISALLFTGIFCFLVIPPLIENPDIIGAFAAGFVNPFAAGYSTDVFFCWFVLAVWIWFEASTQAIRHGWICLMLGIVPGVAVGFALYLILRHSQLRTRIIEIT
jgi:Terpene cyclase DEP1